MSAAGVLQHQIVYDDTTWTSQRPRSTSSALRLYAGHGTTLAGLVNALGKTVDFDHWHEHVHYGKLDYESYLRHDPFLVSLFRSISPLARRYIFTNADRKHAEICMRLLGIAEFFQEEEIICFETLQEHGAGGRGGGRAAGEEDRGGRDPQGLVASCASRTRWRSRWFSTMCRLVPPPPCFLTTL